MRILKILYGNDGGGIFQCEQQFITYWIEKGIKVDSIIIGEGNSTNTYKQIVNKYYTLPNLCWKKEGITPFKQLRNISTVQNYNDKAIDLLGQLSLSDYDAVIFRKHYFTGIASTVSKLTNADLFWHMPISANNLLEKYYFQRLALKNKIHVIGNSKYSMESVGKVCKNFVYPGFNSDRVAVSGTSQLYRKKLSIQKNACVFGVAARITKRKAQHLLIKAFIKLINRHPDAHLMIAGGPLDSEYAKKCKHIASKFNDNIHFIGNVDDISKFYASIDIYVNSRIDAEPFGISVAESLGSALPVIAYKLGGPSEMIQQNINGWLIDSPNSYAYYSALKSAVENKDRWEEMGRNSKNYSEKFNSDYNANKFLEILKTVKSNRLDHGNG